MSLELKRQNLQAKFVNSVATIINDGQAISIKFDTSDDGFFDLDEFEHELKWCKLFIESLYAENNSLVFVIGDLE